MKTMSQKSSGCRSGAGRLAAACAAEAEVRWPVKITGTDADGIEWGKKESATGAGETSGAGWGEDLELMGECMRGYW